MLAESLLCLRSRPTQQRARSISGRHVSILRVWRKAAVVPLFHVGLQLLFPSSLSPISRLVPTYAVEISTVIDFDRGPNEAV